MFQFQAGAIRSAHCCALESASEFVFQFQAGAIRSSAMQVPLNAICVFQFQAGAIRSRSQQARQLACHTLFQFQAGAIRSEFAAQRITLQHRCFNSKLVRLEVRLISACSALITSFNSKLVRLEVQLMRDSLIAQSTVFQFQAGAIRSAQSHFRLGCASVVSIPSWCD